MSHASSGITDRGKDSCAVDTRPCSVLCSCVYQSNLWDLWQYQIMDGSDSLFFLRHGGTRKATFCVILKVTGRLPLDGLSWNCGFWACTKICRLSPILVKMDKSNKHWT